MVACILYLLLLVFNLRVQVVALGFTLGIFTRPRQVQCQIVAFLYQLIQGVLRRVRCALGDLYQLVAITPLNFGFLLGGLLATSVMFPALLRRRSRMDDLGVGALVEAIEHEPIEI